MQHNWDDYFDTSSEYWKKVEKIYEESESFPKKVVKYRNLHHKFPRSFSKKDGVDIDNEEDNLVSLSLADHFRVHYYLWKCSNKGYRGMMAQAFVFMRKKMVAYASDETIEQLAKDYENAMKDVSESKKGKPGPNKGKTFSGEHKRKISESSKGKKMSEEARRKMSEAKKGKTTGPHSEASKKKMSESHKGHVAWNKGKHHQEETRRKIGEARKGMHWYNNGEENKLCYECPNGFIPGRLH